MNQYNRQPYNQQASGSNGHQGVETPRQNPDGTPSFYQGSGSSPSQPSQSSQQPNPSVATGAVGVSEETEQMNKVGQTIQIDRQTCRIMGKFTCRKEDLYALESDKPMSGYDGRCPKCRETHVHFDRPTHGFYVSVKNIHDKMHKEQLVNERLKGRTEIDKLPRTEEKLPPRDHPKVGQNIGIEGDSNSCYIDATIFCMFAYSDVFDSLLHMNAETDALVKLQQVLRDNIVYVLRSKVGFVQRDAVFHLRAQLSKATGDRSFKEVEKDPSEFLRALETLFHYAPLKTIPPDQPPNANQSNVTTNIMWEMFDANAQKLLSTNIASIFRNSLSEIPAKLATIPPFLILVAPRHTRSQRSYRYIIPDRHIDLDNNIVQLVCLKCKTTNHGSESPREFYSCNECYRKDPSSLTLPSIDASTTCYCSGCLKELHGELSEKQRSEHNAKQLKKVKHKLNLFAVLCIEIAHYVAFVKCRNRTQQHEWLFFDSMSDRVYDEQNIPLVDYVNDFDTWIDEAEKDDSFFNKLDELRSQARPTSQKFSENRMRQLRLFRDGAFFFYENANVNYH